MIFIQNKYTSWYYKIINNVILQNRVKSKNEFLYETHHIIPKSLGGSNDKSNLVLLTYREHFICHWLLTKMIEDKTLKMKMLWALSSMRFTTKNIIRSPTSLQYAIGKKAAAIAASGPQPKLRGPRPGFSNSGTFKKGHKLSKETIAKREAARIANGTTNRGRKLAPEVIAQRQATRIANMAAQGKDYLGRPLSLTT